MQIDSQLDARFGALADPTRRAILRLIWTRKNSAGDIANRFDISRPAISRHLRVLREAGLVLVTSAGTARYYRADHEAFFDLRMQFDEFWKSGNRR